MIKFYVYLLIYLIGATWLATINMWLSLAWLIGFILIRLWLGRQMLMPYIWHIETQLWGKPLEKDMWTKEEWQNRKSIKVVWRKPQKKSSSKKAKPHK